MNTDKDNIKLRRRPKGPLKPNTPASTEEPIENNNGGGASAYSIKPPKPVKKITASWPMALASKTKPPPAAGNGGLTFQLRPNNEG